MNIFNAVVASVLMYGLASAWLTKNDQRKLDGFQCRCLRAIWGIQASYISRDSNEKILKLTMQARLTRTLQKQQLLLYGKVARLHVGHPLREATFGDASLRPAVPTVDMHIRRVGRPRSEWAPEVSKLASHA